MKDRPIQEWQIGMMANSLSYRGRDATGLALIRDDGEVHILKNHDPAWVFTRTDAYNNFIQEHLTARTRIALIHTRAYTKGSPFKNDNNHPMYAGKGLIIHNGMIHNDDALFKANEDRGWVRSAETDSDAIRAVLDEVGAVNEKTIEGMNALSGTAAVAAWHPATPTKLLLLKDTNPLMIGCTSDYFAFASDKKALHRCLKPWTKLHNLPMQIHAPDIAFLPMRNESGWIIGPEGFESHGFFQANGVSRFTGNRTYQKRLDWKERHDKLQSEAEQFVSTIRAAKPQGGCGGSSGKTKLPMYVLCPKPECSAHVELEPDQQEMESLNRLACEACGTNLSLAAEINVM